MHSKIHNRRYFAVLAVGVLLLIVIHVFIPGTPRNDVASNSKPTVVKKGTSLLSISEQLKTDGLVNSRYPFLVSSLLFFGGRVVAGEYALSPTMSIFEITRTMAAGERTIYALKIVEGYNLFTVADTIERAAIVDRQSFLTLARDRAFLVRSGITAGSLEGYLAPDTYYFSREIDVDAFIETIIQRTHKFLAREDLKKRMDEVHLNMHQLLVLASIIEKEAKLEEEKKVISAVFHNRLKAGMTLDSDPTVIYGLRSFNRSLKKADLVTLTPYNTYRTRGLPLGPICNPSRSSIVAALYPAPVDYLYFVSRNDGSHVFSKTIREHNHYVMVYQKTKKKNH